MRNKNEIISLFTLREKKKENRLGETEFEIEAGDDPSGDFDAPKRQSSLIRMGRDG